MKYKTLDGINKELSVICLGAGHHGSQLSVEDSFRLLDRFAELGGTFIDTAHVYGAWDTSGYNGGYGNSEKVIGEWLTKSGMHGKIAVATKGAHPDFETGASCMNPEEIHTHIAQSLERLKTDSIDLYWVHKDEPSIPAGEILSMLSEHITAGRLKVIGCSNWRVERQKEAATAAAKMGIPGFCASQVGWSLAKKNQAVATGKHGDALYMDERMLHYHLETGLPAAGYSSQAGGFFAEKYDGLDFESPDFPKPDLTRGYGNSLSYSRRKTAQGLAAEKGCSTNQIALAWMIHHPFPAFPIAGPHSIEQLDDTTKAADIDLSDEEFNALTVGKGYE